MIHTLIICQFFVTYSQPRLLIHQFQQPESSPCNNPKPKDNPTITVDYQCSRSTTSTLLTTNSIPLPLKSVLCPPPQQHLHQPNQLNNHTLMPQQVTPLPISLSPPILPMTQTLILKHLPRQAQVDRYPQLSLIINMPVQKRLIDPMGCSTPLIPITTPKFRII